jgi:hypothetical protein
VFVEGKGEVVPAPYDVRIMGADKLVILDWALATADRRGYRRSDDPWKHGLARTFVDGDLEIPAFAVGLYTKKLAEWAACLWLNSYLRRDVMLVDLVSRRYGSGGIDQRVYGRTIRVVCRSVPDGPNLIRRVDARGAEIPLRARCYVFARYLREEPDYVRLLGTLPTRRIELYPVRPAGAGHKNIEIVDRDLDSMRRLASELRARENYRACR